MPNILQAFHAQSQRIDALKRGGRGGRGKTGAEALLPVAMGWNVPYGSDREKYDDQKAYSYYNSWSYAAIRPIANRIAAQPVQIGRILKGPGGKKSFGTRGRSRLATPVELANMPLHARIKAGLPLASRFEHRLDIITKSLVADSATNIEILEQHPLLECLSDPNERQIQSALFAMTVAGLQMTGKSFWWIIKSKRREGYDLWPLPSTWVSQESNGALDAPWVIRPPSAPADPIIVKYGQMVFFHMPDPTNPFGAMGPSRACTRAILTDDAIQDSQKSGFDNAMIPGLAIILGEVAAGPDGKMSRPELERWQAEQIEQRLNQLYKGASKHQKLIILDRMIKDVKRITFGNTEMDWKESSELIKKRIMQIYGVNPIVAGEMEDANRASALVAQEGFLGNVVNPMIVLMSQCIQDNLLPYFAEDDEQLIVWIEEAEAVDQDAKRADNQMLAQIGAKKINEVRHDYGLAPLGGGDVICVPNTVRFLDPEKDLAKATTPPTPGLGMPGEKPGGGLMKPPKPASASVDDAEADPDDDDDEPPKKPGKKKSRVIRLLEGIDYKLSQRDYNADQPRAPNGEWSSGGSAPLSRMGHLADMVRRIAAPDGGFTYDPHSDAEPKTGFAVSPYPDRSESYPVDQVTPASLASFAMRNKDVLTASPENMFGAWHDPKSGRVFLDISVVKSSKQEAYNMGMQHDQLAGFDLERGESFPINPHATSGGAAKRYGPKQQVGDTAHAASYAGRQDRPGLYPPSVREADREIGYSGAARRGPQDHRRRAIWSYLIAQRGWTAQECADLTVRQMLLLDAVLKFDDNEARVPAGQPGGGQWTGGGGALGGGSHRMLYAPIAIKPSLLPATVVQLHSVASKAAGKLAAAAVKLPKAILDHEIHHVTHQYHEMSAKYGKGVAIAVVATGMAATIGVTTFHGLEMIHEGIGVGVALGGIATALELDEMAAQAPIIAGAKLYQYIRSRGGKKAADPDTDLHPDVDLQQVYQLAQSFWGKIYDEYQHWREAHHSKDLHIGAQVFDESEHPRDDHGRFAPAGGGMGGGQELRVGHTESHVNLGELGGHSGGESDPIPCGHDLDLAVRCLHDGLHVSLNQPDQVATLLHGMRKYVNEVKDATGQKPDLNLCKVSVPGTNLFCHDSLGIPRVRMPQLGGLVTPGSLADRTLPKNEDGEVDLSDKFIEHLKDMGVGVTDEKVQATHLRASQSQLVGAKIAKRMKMIEKGEYDPERRAIFVTRDNYIVDGHHGWATAIADASFMHKMDMKIPVHRIDMDIGKCLDEANKFADHWGIAHARAIDIGRPQTQFNWTGFDRKEYDRYVKSEFQKIWLKNHSRIEDEFADDMEKLFNEQHGEIVRELQAQGVTHDAGKLFDPDVWDTKLKAIAKRHILRAAATGAGQESDRIAVTKGLKYSDDQPRVPAGSSGGGQFAGGAVSAHTFEQHYHEQQGTAPYLHMGNDMVKVESSGQLRLRTPRSVDEAHRMLDAMEKIHDAAVDDDRRNQNAVGHPGAHMRLVHVTAQLQRAVAMGKRVADPTKSEDLGVRCDRIARERFIEPHDPGHDHILAVRGQQTRNVSGRLFTFKALDVTDSNPLLNVPPRIADEIEDYVDYAMSKDYWSKLSRTTRDRLQDAITDYLTDHNADDADSLKGMVSAINDALGPEASKVRAITTARTETTGALNAGARVSIKAGIEDGTLSGLEWLATPDEFTRDTHAEASGQQVEYDDFF